MDSRRHRVRTAVTLPPQLLWDLDNELEAIKNVYKDAGYAMPGGGPQRKHPLTDIPLSEIVERLLSDFLAASQATRANEHAQKIGGELMEDLRAALRQRDEKQAQARASAKLAARRQSRA